MSVFVIMEAYILCKDNNWDISNDREPIRHLEISRIQAVLNSTQDSTGWLLRVRKPFEVVLSNGVRVVMLIQFQSRPFIIYQNSNLNMIFDAAFDSLASRAIQIGKKVSGEDN